MLKLAKTTNFESQKTSVSAWFSEDSFKKTLKYGNAKSSIAGVSGVISELKKDYSDYCSERDSFVASEQQAIDSVFQEYRETQERSDCLTNRYRLALILSVCIMVIGSNFFKTGLLGIASIALYCIVLAVFLFSFVTSIFYRVRAKRSFSLYKSQVDSKKKEAKKIVGAYASGNDLLYKRIDALYLDSLDPAEKQLILMRREEEERYKKQMNAQLQHQAVMESEQRLLREQTAAVAANQQRLLEIAEEQERRRRGY